jgi:hypothetical protein
MPYPQRRSTEAIEFRERKRQRWVCSVPERLSMAAACSDGFIWGGGLQGPRLQGRGGVATGEGRSRGGAGGEEEQGRRCFCFLAALDIRGWTGAHSAALPGGRVQHQGGTHAGEGAGPRQGNWRRRTGRWQGHADAQRRNEKGGGAQGAMQRVSGMFYMGAGTRAQGEGGVQKMQIGTGARLADFYRAKRLGSA